MALLKNTGSRQYIGKFFKPYSRVLLLYKIILLYDLTNLYKIDINGSYPLKGTYYEVVYNSALKFNMVLFVVETYTPLYICIYPCDVYEVF